MDSTTVYSVYSQEIYFFSLQTYSIIQYYTSSDTPPNLHYYLPRTKPAVYFHPNKHRSQSLSSVHVLIRYINSVRTDANYNIRFCIIHSVVIFNQSYLVKFLVMNLPIQGKERLCLRNQTNLRLKVTHLPCYLEYLHHTDILSASYYSIRNNILPVIGHNSNCVASNYQNKV